MPSVHIVTDSSAQFVQAVPTNVTVCANTLIIEGRSYREGVDLVGEDAFRLMAHQPYAPLVQPPSVSDYIDAYTRAAARGADAIISIHASRELSESWQNAVQAAQQVAGASRILVVDSRTISAAQGLLVEAAAQAAQVDTHPDEIVRIVRGAIERVYTVFYVESTDYLMQNRIITPSHSILGGILNIKPVLTLEDGHLVAMEKVRTRAQAIERLAEFAVEFTEVDAALILQPRNGVTDQTRMLQERLAVEFPDRSFPYGLYNASLAAIIGVDALGLVVLESENDRFEDDF